MTDLTLEELAELESAHADATPDPWCAHPNGTSVWSGRDYETSETTDHLLNATSVTERACQNVELTVDARNALPALLAMARELVRLRSALEFLAGAADLFDLWKENDGFHAETPHGLHGVTAADATQALMHHCRRRGWSDPFPPPPAMEKP